MSSAGDDFCRFQREPGRLWSLWDMLTFNAHAFFLATNELATIRSSIYAAIVTRDVHGKPDDETPSLVAMREILSKHIEELSSNLENIGARFTMKAVTEFKPFLSEGVIISLDGMMNSIDDIETSLRRELSDISFLVMDSQEKGHYEQREPLFGSDVAAKFPSIAYEISEAGKCLALERSTASAFHSIRALEGAIRALSRCLAIPDPTKPADRSWFKMLKLIYDEMIARWPHTANRARGDGQFFEEAHALLNAMQNPYRNATMHLDQKYTQEESRDILQIVGAFMRKLASRMDEDGVPLA
jgi:hypothetical protein